MNIKQKLTWVFAAVACLPVILVAVLVVLNLRSAAQANFLDSSGREIRQIDNGMKQFFESIRQNVEYLAKDPRIEDSIQVIWIDTTYLNRPFRRVALPPCDGCRQRSDLKITTR